MTHVFWCGVASRAHVIYGAAWLRQLPGPVKVSLFPTSRFLGAPQLTAADVQSMLPEHIPVHDLSGSPVLTPGEDPVLLSVGAVGLKPWLAVRRAVGVRRMRVVVTDEGLGSYGTWVTRRRSWAREGVREPWRSLRTAAVFGGTAALATSRWRLHLKTPEGWDLNRPVADEFRRHGSRRRTDGGAVFLSQPWPELGIMTESHYLDHVGEVAAACAEAGLAFSVRPHPGEDPARYGSWTVHPSATVAELDQATLNATVLLGSTSTGMLNVAAIHGVPTMRVGTQELDMLDRQLSSEQASLLRHHVGEVVPPLRWASTLNELSTRVARG